jgi:osmoprotectant transport system permease protein
MIPAIRNKVLLTLVAVAALAVGLGGLVGHAPNRLVSGQSISLWQAAAPSLVAVIAILGGGLLAAAFMRRGSWLSWIVMGLAALLILAVLAAAGQAADSLAAIAKPAARTSLGAAFWITSLCAALAIVDALQRVKTRPLVRIAVAAGLTVAIALMAQGGVFDALSIVQEYQHRRAAFAHEFGRHCLLAGSAVGAALAIGIPLGIAVARRPAAQGPVFTTLNLVQTIPSLALFGLLIGPLSALGAAVPALGAAGISGIGFTPAITALVLYALLPIVRNTHAGIVGIDPAILESAVGMGLTQRQVLWAVELPLALPVLLAGIRIVTVQAIGLAVVAALIGAGGLGTFVFQGLGQYAADLVLLGALPAIFLALVADLLLRSVTAALQRGANR